MNCLLSLLMWLYRCLVALYPPSYREDFAEEMEEVFRQRVEKGAAGNPLRALMLLLCEARDLPMNLMRAYGHQQAARHSPQIAVERVYRGFTGGNMMQQTFGMARAATGGMLFAVVAICIIVAVYQNLMLVCRPNCAGADLRGAFLYRPYLLRDPDFGFSIGLRDVDFRDARLDQIDLRGGRLRFANLNNASLTYATLRHADLSHADLFRANLYDADLRSATLTGADLRQAYMIKADLRGADLKNVNLAGAQYSQLTQWPEGFDPQAAGAIFHYICEPRPFCK